VRVPLGDHARHYFGRLRIVTVMVTIAGLMVFLTPRGATHEESVVGVPPVDVDFSQDVEVWWRSHPFNPRNPTQIPIGSIQSPLPIRNVKEDFDGDIQRALASLPDAGGTLYFSPGSYENTISLIGRSNVHFISGGGATIIGGLDDTRSVHVLANMAGSRISADYGKFADCLYFRNDPHHEACVRQVKNPAKNIYFKNLTFDGNSSAKTFFFIRNMRDVVFDNITFQNIAQDSTVHPGMVNGNATIANIWCRGCRFRGRAAMAWVMDGLHGGGVIESTVEPGASTSTNVLFLTNDDFTVDLDGNGVITLDEQRVTQYAVVYGNMFPFSHVGIGATAANSLIMNNVSLGNNLFVNFDIRHANRSVRYEFFGNKVIGNSVQSTPTLVDIGNNDSCVDKPPGNGVPVYCASAGRYTIQDNSVGEGLSTLVRESVDHLVEPITVGNNCVSGTLWGTGTPCPIRPGHQGGISRTGEVIPTLETEE
jgi:hypothetical protein